MSFNRIVRIFTVGRPVLAALLLSAVVTACTTVQTTQPGTVGITRAQSMAVSSRQIDEASQQAYTEMLRDAQRRNALNRDSATLARIQSIARRLIPQTRIFRADAPNWRWEVNLFQGSQVNAFCMAGGKIGVYSGLIDRLQPTDDELAAILGHEMAHALREHVREQVSRQYATQLPVILIAIATGNQALAQLGEMVSNVTLNLPRTRQAESEADNIGVELAARAGYDPRAAVTLWQKMGRLGGSRPPEFMSTHPSPAQRQAELARAAELVMPLYRDARR